VGYAGTAHRQSRWRGFYNGRADALLAFDDFETPELKHESVAFQRGYREGRAYQCIVGVFAVAVEQDEVAAAEYRFTKGQLRSALATVDMLRDSVTTRTAIRKLSALRERLRRLRCIEDGETWLRRQLDTLDVKEAD
jgi:hypothetical protein